ncbi:MAG: thioesterase [Fervidobacterium sp.]|nr:thioesterase [Fervidobacterium sp.]
MGENLEKLVGLNKSIEVLPDESTVWDEDEEMANLHLVSTSGLLREINYVTGEFLNSFLGEDEISVVVYSELSHLKPVVVGERLIVGIRVSEVSENVITFKAIVMRENEKVAEASIKRAVVSRNYLKRKAIERF